MKPYHSTSCWPGQRGMSLVELMVAMTLGLILLIALAYFFLGSAQLNRTHDDVSRMQESGRNALEIMGRAIRQAGERPASAVTPTGTFLFPVVFPGVATMEGVHNPAGTPDSITVRYAAQEDGESDCIGTTVAANGLVTYAFAVDSSDPANPQLTCNNGTATFVVADNIEDMQITYGLDGSTSEAKDGVINSYTTDATGPTAAQFPFVAAVRIVLTVRGPTLNAATGGGYLRQTYNATFTVRNQAK